MISKWKDDLSTWWGRKQLENGRTSCWSVVRKPQQSWASLQVITVDERHWFFTYLWKRVCWQTWASLECGWEMPGPSVDQQVASWVNQGCVKLGQRTGWGRQVHVDRNPPILMGPHHHSRRPTTQLCWMHRNVTNLVRQQQHRGLLPGKVGEAQSSYFELRNRIQSQDTYSLVVTSWQDDLQNP